MRYLCSCGHELKTSTPQECDECGEFVSPIIAKDPPRAKSPGGMRRTKLKPVSAKQRDLLVSYQSSVPLNEGGCARCGTLDNLQKHHPYGRSATKDGKPCITLWIWLCYHCHDWVHVNSNQAYAEGWLQPEYRNQTGTAPEPWNNNKS